MNVMQKDGKYIIRAKNKRFPRWTAIDLILHSLRLEPATITYFWDAEQKEQIELIKNIYGDLPWSTSLAEAYQVHTAVLATQKIPGDLAEVGVFRGGSAKIISKSRNKGKALHLFDTFGEGLPEPDEKFDSPNFKKGGFNISETEFENIKKRFHNESNVFFYPGVFPTTATPIKNTRFSFVNLDVDIYSSTRDCLSFFYEKMNRGGIILSHDYNGALGVKKAFDEFFRDKPEPMIKLSTSQCLVVKI